MIFQHTMSTPVFTFDVPTAKAAMSRLVETATINNRRERAGHPPVPCQLTGDQAAALKGMVDGLCYLLELKKGGGK